MLETADYLRTRTLSAATHDRGVCDDCQVVAPRRSVGFTHAGRTAKTLLCDGCFVALVLPGPRRASEAERTRRIAGLVAYRSTVPSTSPAKPVGEDWRAQHARLQRELDALRVPPSTSIMRRPSAGKR